MAYNYKPYEESDAVKQYREQMAAQEAAKPGPYASTWEDQLKKTVEQITSRPGFQYNLGSDPLYQQYKQQAMRQGKMAMQDTMGAAAAMNGGYGSSYAQMAGQQAYNGQIQQLNDRIPELYALALDKYQMEGDDLLRRYGILGEQESRDYSRYQDQEAAWRTDRNFAADQFNNERSWDYGMYGDEFNRDFTTTEYNEELARKQVDYLISIGAEVPEGLAAAAGYDAGYLEAIEKKRAAAAAGGSGGGSVTVPATTASRNPGSTQADINAAAAAGLKNGYSAADVLEALKAKGVSATQANEAVRLYEKKEQILADKLEDEKLWAR